nr:MAG TPA: hypothetical protein [Caudoviricetes sp.]DAS02817.1 MAG TPA: hypothetical protein [Caudoviricetes sp.]
MRITIFGRPISRRVVVVVRWIVWCCIIMRACA